MTRQVGGDNCDSFLGHPQVDAICGILYGQDRRDWRDGTLVHGRVASPSLSLRGSRSMNSAVQLPRGWPSFLPLSVIRIWFTAVATLGNESPCVQAFAFSECSCSILCREPHAAAFFARVEQSMSPPYRFSRSLFVHQYAANPGFVPF